MQRIKKCIHWFNRPNKSALEEFATLLLILFVVRTWVFGLYQVPSGSMETTMLIGERFFADKFSYRFIRNPRRGEIISFNEPTFRYSDNSAMRLFQKYVGFGLLTTFVQVPLSKKWLGPESWTKRLIGIPGDHVQGKIEDGHPVIYLNGEKLDEPYLNKYPLVLLDYSNDWRSYDPACPYDEQPFYCMDGFTVKKIKRLMEEHHNLPAERKPGTPIDLTGASGSDVFDVYLKDNEYWAMGDNRLGSADSRSWGPLKGDLIHGRIVFRFFSIDSRGSWIIWDLLTHPIGFWKQVRWSRMFQWLK